MTVQFDEDKQNRRLDDFRKKEEEELVKIMADKTGLPYLDLGPVSIGPDALQLVEEPVARKAKIAVFNMVGQRIKVAVLSMEDPDTEAVLANLGSRGFEVIPYLVSNGGLEKAWSRYKDISLASETKAGSLDISGGEITRIIGSIKTIEDVRKLVQEIVSEKKSYRISRFLEIVLAGAIATAASDIHIEPVESKAGIRYRLDGVLVHLLDFDSETYQLVLSRVKLLSGLKLNIKAMAQDGRFSVVVKGSEFEIRTSMLPGAYGESIVMRLLNPDTLAQSLDLLGIQPRLYEVLKQQIDRPNGMVLTTGPTGSGKTTTLYSFMKRIFTPEIKIITIEDPIEYHLEGIVQTQVNKEKGYEFGSGLRAALRQDPDVIMVGEIRDSETAETAINSALTGHLVFSTLHTNNAAGTFPRLLDLGVNPRVMSSAINVSMAQRLVRILCKTCRKHVEIDEKTKARLQAVIDSIYLPEFRVPVTEMWESVGCSDCNGTGFKGRIGIYEAIIMNKQIEEVILNNPSEREIKAAAVPEGHLDMRQDGVIKVLTGVTSLAELIRVIDLEEV